MALSDKRQLLAFPAPTPIYVEPPKEGATTLTVKGFASVATDDRSGDFTSPFEFNVAEFMAAPTLLFNHKFWIDEMGNHVAIGSVEQAVPAELRNNPKDSDSWIVWDLGAKKQLTTFPKNKVPSLSAKARGLFVIGRVTQPRVIEQILAGEVGGMSWRGLVVIDFDLNPATNETRRVLKDIDLYEISLTHIPDHNQSTFVVGKNVDGKFQEVPGVDISDVELWKVELSKSVFPSEGTARDFLKLHRLEGDLRDEGEAFVCEQRSADDFDLSKTVRVKMAGAFMWMAPPVESPEPSQFCRLVAELVDVAKATPVIKETGMSEDSTDKAAATDSAAATPESTDTNTPETADVEKKAPPAEGGDGGGGGDGGEGGDMSGDDKKKTEKSKTASDQLAVLGNHVAQAVANTLEPTFKSIAEGLGGMKTAMEKMAAGALTPEKTETNTETATDTESTPKQEAAKTAEGVLAELVNGLNTVAEAQMKQQSQIAEIAKAAVSIGESIPNAGLVRQETPAQAKQETDDDPNACFDSTFAWLNG